MRRVVPTNEMGTLPLSLAVFTFTFTFLRWKRKKKEERSENQLYYNPIPFTAFEDREYTRHHPTTLKHYQKALLKQDSSIMTL